MLHVYATCSWYKSKYSSNVDEAVFNTGNTAATYGEQRIFLAANNERSTRLLSALPTAPAHLASARGTALLDVGSEAGGLHSLLRLAEMRDSDERNSGRAGRGTARRTQNPICNFERKCHVGCELHSAMQRHQGTADEQASLKSDLFRLLKVSVPPLVLLSQRCDFSSALAGSGAVCGNGEFPKAIDQREKSYLVSKICTVVHSYRIQAS